MIIVSASMRQGKFTSTTRKLFPTELKAEILASDICPKNWLGIFYKPFSTTHGTKYMRCYYGVRYPDDWKHWSSARPYWTEDGTSMGSHPGASKWRRKLKIADTTWGYNVVTQVASILWLHAKACKPVSVHHNRCQGRYLPVWILNVHVQQAGSDLCYSLIREGT